MTDPLTLTVLGGVAASEGIKFLYGQASELLKAWRAKRDQSIERLAVPVTDPGVLDAAAPGAAANAAVVQQRERELVDLLGQLAPYADGAPVDPHDRALATTVHRLRDLLEHAYEVHLTFRGEQRPPTGSRVEVRQRFDTIEGEVTGVDVGTIGPAAEVSVEQEAEQTKQTGSVTGVRADRIG